MSLPPNAKQIGRLAMRQEGDNWTAYYALPNTMDGAIWLGSVKMAFVGNAPDRKQIFMDLMRECVSDIIQGETGVRPTWGGPSRAPESERSGSA